MPQTGTGWTQYHDFLMQQAIAMMAEPDWANNPALMAQLTPIQDELRAAGASLGENDAEIKDLFDQFQQAYERGTAATEQRYGQLLADANGKTPTIYNPTTKQWEQNQEYQAPLSYNQRIDDLLDEGGVYDKAQSRYDTTQTNQKDALDAASSGLNTRATTLGTRADNLAGTTRNDYSAATGKFDTRATNVGNDLSGVMGGYKASYNDPSGILAGYNNRATSLGGQVSGVQGNLDSGLQSGVDAYGTRESTVNNDLSGVRTGFGNQYNGANGIISGYGDRATSLGGQVSGVQGDLANAMGGISSRYGTRESDLQGLLSGYGDIQRDDLNRQYDALSKKSQAQLQNTGLGNSTVMNSVTQGVDAQRQLDRARLEDQLRREQLGYQSQWSSDTLGAQEREAQTNAQYGMMGVDRNAQYGADTLAARQGYASEDAGLGTNQAGMRAGLLGDTANARMSAANTNAGYGMQGVGMNAQYGAEALGAREGFAGNSLNAGFDQANINAGLLGDAASAQMSAAGANAQAGQQALGTNVGLTSDYWSAQQQNALANGQMGLQGANWAGQVANTRNQLTGEPLRVIEARTDITPSLPDVANMAMQVGTSQSTQFALPGMSPTSYYQQPTQGRSR